LLCAALLTACGARDGTDSAESASELVIGVSEARGDTTEFGLDHLVAQITQESFTQIAADGRALPRLAAKWAWEADDRRLRLTLRDGIVLHAGRALDSQLAAEALAMAIAQDARRAGYPALRDVSAAIPDGPLQLVLEVSTRSALLPEDLTVLLDLPVGPYRIVRRSDSGIELEGFERYYMGAPAIRQVVLRPFDTLRTGWARLLRGELDFVYDVPGDAKEFLDSDEARIVPVKRWYQFVIAFNSRSGPLRSAQVRRALNLAVDRESLVRDILRGAGTPSSGPLWPEYWAADSAIAPYSFDPAEASALLEAAGYPIVESSRGGPAARFQITCLLPENFSVVERIALHVQKSLFNVGVDLQFKVVPLDEFGKLMASGQFEATLLDMVSGPTPGRAYIFWASAQRLRGAYNVFGYDNPESDRLFDVLRTSRNEAAVRSAARRLQRVHLDDPPALFLAWTERARVIRREFTFPEQPGVDPVYSLWRWTRQPDTLVASRQ
jgi:peptide/nickel transport system substrate-binding protein